MDTVCNKVVEESEQDGGDGVKARDIDEMKMEKHEGQKTSGNPC